jgi:hypothetical protein
VGGPENRANNYRYLARLNFECAYEADQKIGGLPGYEIAAPPPVMTLCAHSIELALKSYLLQHEIEEKEVKKLGHNLLKAWQKCKDISCDLPELDENILSIISDLLVSGRLRYGEDSKLGKIPVYGPLTEVVRTCLKLCSAPKLSDLVRST